FPAYMYWGNVPSLLLSVMMVVGAVGLLRLRPWGWYVTRAWGLSSCAVGVLGLALTLWFITPAMTESYDELLAKVPPPPPGQPDMRPVLAQSVRGGLAIGLVTGLTALAYPVVMLGTTSLPSVRNAFRPEAPDSA